LKHYTRFGVFSINDVLDQVEIEEPIQLKTSIKKNPHHYHEFNGFQVKVHSKRLMCYKKYGTKCAKCGMEGFFFALERHSKNAGERPHMNLYAIDKNGYECMITLDHIIPKSKGGKDESDNFQPLCCHCNFRKGDKLE